MFNSISKFLDFVLYLLLSYPWFATNLFIVSGLLPGRGDNNYLAPVHTCPLISDHVINRNWDPRKCSLFPLTDNSKYNLCAGISNEINSCFHVQPSRIRNLAKSLWKYILYRKVHWGGVQMGIVSWSQPFRHFSFPAKKACGQSEIKSDPDQMIILEENSGVKHTIKWQII